MSTRNTGGRRSSKGGKSPDVVARRPLRVGTVPRMHRRRPSARRVADSRRSRSSSCSADRPRSACARCARWPTRSRWPPSAVAAAHRASYQVIASFAVTAKQEGDRQIVAPQRRGGRLRHPARRGQHREGQRRRRATDQPGRRVRELGQLAPGPLRLVKDDRQAHRLAPVLRPQPQRRSELVEARERRRPLDGRGPRTSRIEWCATDCPTSLWGGFADPRTPLKSVVCDPLIHLVLYSL